MDEQEPPKIPPEVGRVIRAVPEGEGASLHFNTTQARKAAYIKAARAEGKRLIEWVFEHLDRASGFDPEEK